MTMMRIKLDDMQIIRCSRTLLEVKSLISTLSDYDCFLVNRRGDFDGQQSELISLISSTKSDWIEIFGCNAERIHDAIDLASVVSGRQKVVGDGVPMTSWNDYESSHSVVDYICTGGHGVSDHKLLFFIGRLDEETEFWEQLTHSCA